MFQHYNKEAPLLIIIMPNGDKLQLHVRKDDIQFMDARDQDVEDTFRNAFAIYWLSKGNLKLSTPSFLI